MKPGPTTPTLKPCPFCHSRDVEMGLDRSYGHGGGPRTFYIRCNGCRARGPAFGEEKGVSHLEVVLADLWNRREEAR